jgi:nitrate reductase NapE component
MFERSWKKVSSWRRKRPSEGVANILLVIALYTIIAFVGGLAAILWGIV